MADYLSEREAYFRREDRRADIEHDSIRTSYQKDNIDDCQSTKRPRKISSEVHKYVKEGNDRVVHRTRHNQSYAKRVKFDKHDLRNSKNSFYPDQHSGYEYFERDEDLFYNSKYLKGSSQEYSDDEFDENGTFNKKAAFLRVLKDSPKMSKIIQDADLEEKTQRPKKSEENINATRLFVGNLFSSVENEDIERLLEPYGSIIEVRRYEKHAIVTLNCLKETAEQATKDLDHNHWMDNWIRVKLDKFEMSKEESWKVKTTKVGATFHSKYAHCDRSTNSVEDRINIKPTESGSIVPGEVSANTEKCKVVDDKSKRALSRFLKDIRHDHCVEVVDSLVKAKENGFLEITKEPGSAPIITGIQVTSKSQDPRTPIDYGDIDF